MAYGSITIEVMIASPSDVMEERTAIENVLHRWNYSNSLHRKLILLPRRWESSTAPVSGERAQAIIIKQMLEHCDILVAIFWSKVGSPTGEYPSGTIEEIRTHIDSGKPAMIYFSSAATPTNADLGQVQQVREFKNDCMQENSPYRGLFAEYENVSDLKEKFREHLEILLNSNEYIQQSIQSALVTFFSDTIQYSTIESSRETEETLSETARNILAEACQDPYGTIYRMEFIGGQVIQTNGKQFVAHDEPRKDAELDEALRELEYKDLIKDEGYERKNFKVMTKGYKLYDAQIAKS